VVLVLLLAATLLRDHSRLLAARLGAAFALGKRSISRDRLSVM